MRMEWNYTEDENFTDFYDEEIINGNFTESGVLSKVLEQTLNVLSTILIICGIVENFVICWISVRTKKCLKSFSNFHLFNLAVTDILFRIISTPDLLIKPIDASDVRCKTVDFGKYATLAVTFSLLAGIAFDRYMHIVHPFKARSITWKQSRNLVAASWIYGAVFSAPFLYSSKSLFIVDEVTQEKFWFCYDITSLHYQISSAVFLACSFVFPLIFMGITYGKVVRFLSKRARNKLINSQIAKAKFRAVKMMVLIVFTYLVTWGPQLIWQSMDAFGILIEHASPVMSVEDTVYEEVVGDSVELHEELRKQNKNIEMYFLITSLFETLTFASSVLNPLMFGYYNRNFQDEFKKIFCGNKWCGQCFKKRKQEVRPYLKKRDRQFSLDFIAEKDIERNFATTRL